MHIAGRVMLTVFVPILLGIAAGMITYLLGMLLGAMVAFVWAKIRPNRQYAPIALEDDDDEPRNSLEKVPFVDEEAIVAPPVYVEVEAKELQ